MRVQLGPENAKTILAFAGIAFADLSIAKLVVIYDNQNLL